MRSNGQSHQDIRLAAIEKRLGREQNRQTTRYLAKASGTASSYLPISKFSPCLVSNIGMTRDQFSGISVKPQIYEVSMLGVSSIENLVPLGSVLCLTTDCSAKEPLQRVVCGDSRRDDLRLPSRCWRYRAKLSTYSLSCSQIMLLAIKRLEWMFRSLAHLSDTQFFKLTPVLPSVRERTQRRPSSYINLAITGKYGSRPGRIHARANPE